MSDVFESLGKTIEGWKEDLGAIEKDLTLTSLRIESAQRAGNAAEARAAREEEAALHGKLTTSAQEKRNALAQIEKAVNAEIRAQEAAATEALELEQKAMEQMRIDHEAAIEAQEGRIAAAAFNRSKLRGDHAEARSTIAAMGHHLDQRMRQAAAMV